VARHIVIEQAQIYNVQPSDIMSLCRIAGISKARHAVMWNIKKSIPGISDRQIGNLLDRDRTTVIHGIAAHEKRMGKQK
jgi:chromosomal replication initiation ATPase DnaA